MRILIATGLYPPEVGGPATYSKLLVDELPRYGIEPSVLAFNEVRSLPTVLRHIVYFFKVIKRSIGCSVIYAQDPVSVGLPALFAAKITGKRFFLKVVGDYAWEQFMQIKRGDSFVTPDEFQTGSYDWKTEVRRKVERFVGRSADRVIVPSLYLKSIVKAWGIDENKLSVIYNAFEAPDVIQTKSELKEKLNIKGTVLLSAGRMVPWKGFEMLIRIMPKVVQAIPDAVLYIAGDGPDEIRLRNLAKHSMTTSIVFLGRLAPQGLYRYIRLADLFVLNTGYEGFSHQLLEVASLGTPIVTTAVCGNPELIEDGRSGRLVPYNDEESLLRAIIETLKDSRTRAEYVKEARTNVLTLNKQRMLMEFIKLLQ